MKWIKFELEKPIDSDYYYVKGKGDRKALIYFCNIDNEWELGNLAVNHFSDSNIYWLKELN